MQRTPHAHAPRSADEGPPPVDPDLLEDYAEFKQWKRLQEERQQEQTAAAVDFENLVLEIQDGQDVHSFRMVDVTDRDVHAHLEALSTFAENNIERASALFQTLLEPGEYDRLKRLVGPMFRRVAAAHRQDPTQPSVEDVWVGMARTITKPIEELQADPKRLDSLRGHSSTGHSSSTGSEPTSALPPAT